MKHLDQYAGPFAMDESKFRGVLEIAQRTDIAKHQAEFMAVDRRQMGQYRMSEDGFAVIDMTGPMTKYGSSFNDAMPFGTIGVRKAVRNAVKDTSAKGIVLVIDSPGGSVAGTGDLAADVAAAAKVKPVVAYIEDMGASAAYWVASQASHIVANPSAIVGSIGTYMVVEDLSAMNNALGVKTHVVRAGEMKGAGTPGEEITDEQLADMQRLINEINGVFTASVKKGRRMTAEQLTQVTDGRAYVASVAKDLGLVDAIGGYESALKVAGQLRGGRAAVATAKTQGEKVMEDITTESAAQPTKPKAASYADLKACLPGADAEFICAQLGKNATLDQAQSAWMEEQNKRIEAAKAQAAEAKAQAAEAAEKAKASTVKTGVEPLASAGKQDNRVEGDPVSEFESLLSQKMATGLRKSQAALAIARENPALVHAYNAAYNTQRVSA